MATLYNAHGQAVQVREGQGDVQLPVAHLPAASYRLVLRRRADGAWLAARGVVVK